MPAERTPRDAVCDWEQISKIRARHLMRLDESCNFSRVTEGRPWTVRPGSGLQKSYSRQPGRPFSYNTGDTLGLAYTDSVAAELEIFR